MQYVSLGAAIVLNAVANILIKSAMRQAAEARLSGMASWRALVQPGCVLGLACFAVALVVYALALRRIDLSVAYPVMTSLCLILVVVYSSLVLHEVVAGLRLVGIVLIIAGVVMISQTDSSGPGRPSEAANVAPVAPP